MKQQLLLSQVGSWELDAEEVVGNSTGAAALRSKASAMKEAMMALLWDGTDHFVTQVDPAADLGELGRLSRPAPSIDAAQAAAHRRCFG